jgi:ferric-dicitrate binding protein FerR (iron transport regulator)
MSPSPDWKLMARYLAKECSMEEKEKFESWLNSNQENQKLLKTMETIWNAPDAAQEKSDINKLWKEMKLEDDPSPQQIFFPVPQRKFRFLPIAAALILTFLLSYFFIKTGGRSSGDKDALEWTRINVSPGQKTHLTLNDGSLVTLDAGSVFRYQKEFKGKERKVYLEGEGYFEVSSDSKRPFVILAHDAVIKVLGTKFNIRAWQQNEKIRVVVAEGSVSMNNKEEADDRKVIIREGQMSTLSENGLLSEPQETNISDHIGWLQKQAVFEDTALHEILFQLERWYGLNFVLEDKAIAAERLTIHIENMPVDDILELIATLTDLKYERTDNTVYLKSENN